MHVASNVMSVTLFAGMFLAVTGLSCKPNQRIVNSAQTPAPTSPDRPQVTGFEADLEAMRTADFNFIYVFRRKDGGVLENDDKAFINSNKPMEVNRVRLSDNGRAVIFGTNFLLPPEAIKRLKDNYTFEDHSKPGSATSPDNTGQTNTINP